MATTSKFDFGLINDQIASKANAIPNAHQTAYGTDLNNYIETGMYGIEGATNYPTGDSINQYGTLTVNRYSNTNYITQIWQSVINNKAWIRIKTNGTWSVWNELALADQIAALGPIANLTSTSDTAALAASQGKIINDRFSTKQISDNNIFQNTFEIFYDWSGYLNSKTGMTGPTSNFLDCVRVPSLDTNAIPLLGIRNGEPWMHLYVINVSNNTIIYKGKATFTS